MVSTENIKEESSKNAFLYPEFDTSDDGTRMTVMEVHMDVLFPEDRYHGNMP
jgi:hypothetical protein